jgi:excisionase family DNA binding protein
MKNKASKIILSAEEETAVQAIATRMSEQISLVVAGSLREILFVLREDGRGLTLQPSADQDEFLTAGEVATILKISKSQVYHMIQTRDIPSFSIGRTVRVRRMDLDAVIEAHMTIKVGS